MQYSNKLAKKHAFNGYDGNVISIKEIIKRTEKVIDKKYLK